MSMPSLCPPHRPCADGRKDWEEGRRAWCLCPPHRPCAGGREDWEENWRARCLYPPHRARLGGRKDWDEGRRLVSLPSPPSLPRWEGRLGGRTARLVFLNLLHPRREVVGVFCICPPHRACLGGREDWDEGRRAWFFSISFTHGMRHD